MNLLFYPEQIPSLGGFRATEDVYRTGDGQAIFKFRFVKVGSKYEIDIVNMPSYTRYGRSGDLHLTHRLPSDRGGHKICFGDPSIVKDLNAARQWAKNWSEETWKYLQRGEAFSNNV